MHWQQSLGAVSKKSKKQKRPFKKHSSSLFFNNGENNTQSFKLLCSNFSIQINLSIEGLVLFIIVGVHLLIVPGLVRLQAGYFMHRLKMQGVREGTMGN